MNICIYLYSMNQKDSKIFQELMKKQGQQGPQNLISKITYTPTPNVTGISH